MANTTGKKFGGRAKGTPNKKTQELLDMVTATGCPHPIQGMAEVAVAAREADDYELAQSCYKEIAQYIVPKKRSVEHKGEIDTKQPFVIVVPDIADDN